MTRFTPVVLFAALAFGSIARPDIITIWNEAALDAIRIEKTAPPVASRALAIIHISIYDAVNGITPTHQPYHVQPAAMSGASVEAAVASAAHDALVALFPNEQVAFDAALIVSLGLIPDGASEDDGVAWGQTVAAAILALRANDGSTDTVIYTPGAAPGDWQPTPPAFAAAALPQWPEVTPFALTSGSQFRGSGPPALASADYAAAYNDVKLLGEVDSATRTADQTEIAHFWINGPGTATPPGHWNTIAQIVSEDQVLTVEENARLFALLNIALADAAIVSWDNKFTYNFWRPVTAIPRADEDGNDATAPQADWLPLIPTPPFPEYTSGHSTFSGAASKVLERFFGTDNVSFTTGSDGLPGVERSYTSFSQAANESGRSRIYGGIHYEFANQDGLSSGRQIGDFVVNNELKAVVQPTPRLCGILGLGNLSLMLGMILAMRWLPVARR